MSKMSKIKILGMVFSLLLLIGSFSSVLAGCEIDAGCQPPSSSSLCDSSGVDRGSMTKPEGSATIQRSGKPDYTNGLWEDMG